MNKRTTSGKDAGASDAAVIAASLSRPLEFTRIFERHNRVVYGFMVRRVGFQRAEDLTSEVFIRAFDHRARFDGTYDSARPWIFGIARNVYLNAQRSRSRRREFPTDNAEPTAPQPDLADEVVTSHAAASTLGDPALAQALAELHPDIRETLLMFTVDELTYQEIADILEVPLGTVRSRIGRARKHIREQVGWSPRKSGEGSNRV